MDQIKALYKISQVLTDAFKEVNNVCAHYLADKSIDVQQQDQHQIPKTKQVQKPKPKVDNKTESKPQPKINYAQRLQHKVDKPKQLPQPTVQKQKPVVQSKPQPISSNKTSKIGHNPQRPKQPLSAFFLFSQQQKDNIKKMHPNAGITDLAKMMGQVWRGLDPQEQAPYIKRNQIAKQKYDKQMKKFFQKFPQEKSKKQLKRQKAESKKKQEEIQAKSPAIQKSQPTKSTKKPILIEEQNSQSNESI